jgi:hypothetical protein
MVWEEEKIVAFYNYLFHLKFCKFYFKFNQFLIAKLPFLFLFHQTLDHSSLSSINEKIPKSKETIFEKWSKK